MSYQLEIYSGVQSPDTLPLAVGGRCPVAGRALKTEWTTKPD